MLKWLEVQVLFAKLFSPFNMTNTPLTIGALAARSLVVFVWLLTLHPAASGRVYGTDGAVYIATALGWLYVVDGVTPTWNDYVGVGLALAGAGVIAVG
jgi:drug/metabolite transporter superfamily protein YnfA